MNHSSLAHFFRQILLCLLCASFCSPSLPAENLPDNNNPALSTLIEKAHQKNLAHDRYWRLLLHYKKDLFGVEKSDIDRGHFFISKNGRKDPSSELDATLAAFFNPPIVNPDEEHPQCRYPARYAWLKEQLGFPPELQEMSCPRYESWRDKMDPGSISLVFASYYMNNPASMYGHTFFLLGRKERFKDQPLLNYTINFAAMTNTRNGILFALFGLTGGFPGVFSTHPYYMKVQQYNNLESRDLWEYRLTLDENQLNRLIQHLWELGNGTAMSYFFFNKNCSYQLLPLLEVADPSLHLSDRFRFRAIPLDTLRCVLEQPGLVSTTTWRPSYLQQMLSSRDRLNSNEIRLSEKLVLDKPGESRDQGLVTQVKQLPPERQMLVLETANDFLRYKSGFQRDQSENAQQIERRILILKNAIPVDVSNRFSRPNVEPAPPESAHKTGRLGVSGGVTKNSSFEEFSVRSALQDLEGDDTGFVFGSLLEMAQLKIRYDNRFGKLNLEDFTLFNVKSLAPWDRWIHHPSWGGRMGFSTAHDVNRSPERSLFFGLDGNTGLTVRIPFLRKGLLYAFAVADSGVGEPFDKHYRIGGGLSSGLLFNPLPAWRVHLSGTRLRYGVGNVGTTRKVRLIQAVQVAQQIEMRLQLERQNSYQEGMLSFNYYY